MTTILYNPKANNGSGEASVRAWVAAHGEDPANMRSVLEIPDLAAFVAPLGADDKIILCGGDGTLMRFADAIRDIDLKVPVYFTPAGTGNDFLRDVRTDEDPLLINKYIIDLPRVIVNGEEHVFVNGIGYGLDGYCCEVGDEIQRNSDKKVNYSAIAIKGILGKFKPRRATVTVDGVTRTYKKAWLAPTMNGRCYGGGLFITPNQDRLGESGVVSCAVVHNYGRLHVLMIFPSIGKGQHLKYKKAVEIREGHEVTVKFDTPCALQIDGETYLGVSEYTVLSRKRVKERAAERAAQGVRAEEPTTV